jgi:hypothetical protein
VREANLVVVQRFCLFCRKYKDTIVYLDSTLDVGASNLSKRIEGSYPAG